MHETMNVKSPNNNSKWQIRFNSAFKGLICCTVHRTIYASVSEGASADDITLPQYLHELSISMMDEVSCVNSPIFMYIKVHFAALSHVTDSFCVVVTISVTVSFCIAITNSVTESFCVADT
jgi:hypothetical protein